MNIIVNGTPQSVSANSTLSELLGLLEIRGRIAVEINGELLPKHLFSTQVLQPGECVEIVRAIGGG
ncbi:MAG: sulfur carrier protein ThiS [Gammaproteobacteria bacterium]|nr:sulfur carrier protein ThiS [Gammaproteobacteria bacterium]